MLLENALSEELPSHSAPLAPPSATDTDKMLAACIGAVLTSVTMTPFDVVKTRLQTQPHPATLPWPPPVPSTSTAPLAFAPAGVACLCPPRPHPPRHLAGFRDALTHIVRAEGPAALWRGTAPALLMSVPGQVVYMVGYDSLRRHALAAQTHDADADAPGLATAAVPLVAGAASRAAVAALLSPFELVRTRLQAQTRATRVPLAALVAQLRWRTAWTGLSSTLWRDVPFSGVYWAGYEAIRRALTGGRGMGDPRRQPDEGGFGEFAVAFASGAGSGVIAATLTNPFDVIKTRRQALVPSAAAAAAAGAVVAPPDTRTLAVLRQIVRQEGYAALWAGLTPRLAKVGPACGLMIGCYEAISAWRAQGRGAGTLAREGDGERERVRDGR
ncbi:hypothetical protein JCM3770_007156 [Rhodotorula araucariae]